MDTDRFSRHLNGVPAAPKRCTLIPDANFSRNVSFHVVRDEQGNDQWIGRYATDLLEYIAVCHEQGLLVNIEGELYLVTVSPAPKGNHHG